MAPYFDLANELGLPVGYHLFPGGPPGGAYFAYPKTRASQVGKRIMFGTDQMVWVETITSGIEAVNSAEFLTKDQKADIFYNNAARFLELSEEEIKQHQSVTTEQTTN